MSEPISQIEVNKAVRVLSGERLLYTARVVFLDGQEFEFQLPSQPSLHYSDEAREVFYRYDGGGSGYTEICRQSLVRLFILEKNP